MLNILAGTLIIGQVNPWIVHEGQKGPGKGKEIVLLAGDEEYRSEEGLPQLAKILANRHGFKCTVLFSIDAKGFIDPNCQTNQPGMQALEHADLCIMQLRFRNWPDEQMRRFADFYLAGKPIIALRTSTHAFQYPPDSKSEFRKYGWQSTEWPGGFGEQVLGENWISHWGIHGVQATRGVSVQPEHPILRRVGQIFGTTDVYEAHPPPDVQVLLQGQVVSGLNSSDIPATGEKRNSLGVTQALNDPMMPIAWTRIRRNEAGNSNRIFVTTMAAATDLLDENLRRMLVNATYWGLGMDVPKRSDVSLVGRYEPSPFGFDKFKRGQRPEDLR
ncbi:MAG TPA: ThuA domain-containing protein [Fimbriimonadaceae bacterium]|nr:ThuA domain-containing protein [Fimbriimonadaceae bacterium]